MHRYIFILLIRHPLRKKSTGTVEWTLLAVTAVRTITIILTRLCYMKFPLLIIAYTEEKEIRIACRSVF